MEDKLFNDLIKSVTEAGAILRGDRKPSRVFQIDAATVREIRENLGLSQKQFASIIHVSMKTLRNWEQGIRIPDGAAAALLTAIRNDPKHVLIALNEEA
jgi:putative transcriptional regulator